MTVSETDLAAIRAGMKAVKAPTQFDRVYKDECAFSFENPFCEEGLFVSLASWYGFARDRVEADSSGNGNTLYLHEKFHKVFKPKEDIPDPTKMAIGVEGGFTAGPQFDIVKDHSLAIVTADGIKKVPLVDDLPTVVVDACNAIIKSDGASYKDDVLAWEDDEAVTDSVYAADLVQISDPPKVSPDPSQWKCQEFGTKDNLWLNLSTGHIGGGRKYADGSGGSGGALVHFENTGKKYPLAVKLGTITPQGGDVFSYAEDRSCRDPKLAEHLANLGIDIMKQEKTVKTTSELCVEFNINHDSFAILEGNKELPPVFGPGFQGLTNIGNSCYIASVMQCLAALPEVAERYYNNSEAVFMTAPDDIPNDHVAQMAKLISGLCSGKHSKEGENDNPSYQVRPNMFKKLFGKNHPEFSSSRQQDAQEYFNHLVETLTRSEHAEAPRLTGSKRLSSLFEFESIERISCNTTKKVRYATSKERMLGLHIPLDAAVNASEVAAYKEKVKQDEAEGKKDEKDEPVIPEVQLQSLLSRYLAPGTINDFYSSALKDTTTATKTSRMKTFPRYFVTYLQRYFVTETWELKKMEVVVPMPETLDLSALKGSDTLQAGEEELPAGEKKKEPEIEPDETIMAQLLSMDFNVNGVKKACLAVKNSSMEAAMEWVLQHMGDDDFAEPPKESQSAVSSSVEFSDEDVQLLMGLGFTEKQVKKALKNTSMSPDRAADWLFSHPDDNGEEETNQSSGPPPEAPCEDGEGKYSLVAFVSHVGKNTTCGHYVAHIKKGGKWYFYNDEKVAESENPPFGFGYMYFYRRDDAADWD